MQEQIYGTTVPCTCLQVQSTREMLDGFSSGKCQAKIIVNISYLGTCVGFRPDFRPSNGGAGDVGVPTQWPGQALGPCLPFCAIPQRKLHQDGLRGRLHSPKMFRHSSFSFYFSVILCGVAKLVTDR